MDCFISDIKKRLDRDFLDRAFTCSLEPHRMDTAFHIFLCVSLLIFNAVDAG